MPKYTCQRCLKEFSQKSHYNKHLKRKNPCKNNKKKLELIVEEKVEKILENFISNNKLNENEIVKNEELNNMAEESKMGENNVVEKDFTKMKRKELIDYCKKNNIGKVSGKKKADIINIIKQKEKKTIKYIDLFCGLGAFHTAFDSQNKLQNNIKYNCVFACDIDKNVRNIYEENYNLKPNGDINNININNIPDFDILCAGFPCQPFSIAGNQKGFKDKIKGNLFYRLLEIIDIKNPSTLFLENVKNLHTIHKGKTFNIIKNELEKRGYIISYKVIDSRFYNSPQSRQRIYIICNKSKKYIFEEKKNKIVPVSSIIDFSITNFFDYKNKYKLEKCNGKSMMKYKLINKKTNKGGRQGERVYGLSSCGPTICASSGGPGAKTGLYYFNGNIRTLTVKETLQMFGFNKEYKYNTLKNKKKMLFYLGNSIVVCVIKELINNLKNMF